jgi:hypothetical protein
MRAASRLTPVRRAATHEMETTMGYYGSDPTPISTEPTIDDSSKAMEAVEIPEGAEGMDEELGDGLRKQKFGW